jgi:23S rRNA (cytidine1920-2'-O)/16S rRNA (cytidine1409-2'-O)-methyltransferase
LLVARGLAGTREKAQALILAGRVTSAGAPVDKPGARLLSDAPLEVSAGPRWVGRGGAKLAGALAALGVVPRGRDALDVGASTGGFTQVLLEAGAARVVALDVGRGQLDWSLRCDERVVVVDGFNARYLSPEVLPFVPALATVDVSFISLVLVLPRVGGCLAPGGEIVALVKPQFEAGRSHVGRGGVVRDPSVHRTVLAKLAAHVAGQGWGLAGCVPSELPGARGNREFFIHVRIDAPGLSDAAIEARIAEITADTAP